MKKTNVSEIGLHIPVHTNDDLEWKEKRIASWEKYHCMLLKNGKCV